MSIAKKLILARPRLIGSLLTGAVVGTAAPLPLPPITRIILGWDLAVWLYLALIGWMMLRASADKIRASAEEEDESAVLALTIVCIAAVASIAAIVLGLATAKNVATAPRVLHFAFTGLTVVGGWCLIPTIFTLHYARLYYQAEPGAPAMLFPDKALQPDYWDFLYFSFTIAVASQTSDVALASPSMRRTALAQSVLSFLFNASILALAINIAASLAG